VHRRQSNGRAGIDGPHRYDGQVKQSESKNGAWDLTRSHLVNAVIEGCNRRFVGVSLLGMIIDVLVFQVLRTLGANLELSQVTSFFAGAILIFALSADGTLSAPDQTGKTIRRAHYGRFLLVSLLALFLRSGVFSLLIRNWHWRPEAAILGAILIGTSIFLAGAVLFVFPQSDVSNPTAISWPVVTISIVAYLFILKLIFVGYVNLIPEEGYYWNYAQHLDIGYLDHPPMVAWLIWLSTSILGRSEISVRLPAFLCWILAAIFMFRLTRSLYGRLAAFGSILLLAVLPIYFGLGFFMTPDAPLFAAWVGCLYFLERALIGGNRQAWWWAGMCLGLGMLSKYSIALLGLGTLVFMLIDRQSRRWLFRTEPYIAAVISAILFSPVLLWNYQNRWMSFVFQSANRWSGSPEFSLHILFGATVLILTPLGLLGVGWLFLPKRSEMAAGSYQTDIMKRRYRWTVTFTLVPLSVFVVYSLLNNPKINWTAPVWLAAIPLLAWDMVATPDNTKGLWAKLSRRLWMPTIIALLFIHGGAFEYITRGLPGVGLMTPGRLFGEWRELAAKVARIETLIEAKTGSKPLIVGMDRNFISSELSFYNDAAYNTGGPHFFGSRSLMWAFWFPRSRAVGRNFLIIDFDRKRLMSPALAQYFETISDVSTETLENNGRVVGYFYWRVGYRYRG
jgi:dolichol-phosphate mannosyltransferase